MISYISAGQVFPVSSPALKNGVIGVDEKGVITAVLSAAEAEAQGIENIEFHDGILVPGFVNTHCHLELSHLAFKIRRHTGLVDFVQEVMKVRAADDYSVELATLKGDVEMFEDGIVAVADISNQAISRSVKLGSPIYYHTFLEVMGFNPATSQLSIDRANSFAKEFGDLPLSIVPHAPYSVSKPLFAEISKHAQLNQGILSIHNQETPDEDMFFKNKTGKFLELYQFLGLDIDFFQPSGKSSLQSYLPMLPPQLKTLLVHNTFSTLEDVKFAESIHPNLYWCLCPNANLFIENKIPDVEMLRNAGVRITLGTDSLASNDRLSILGEMDTLRELTSIPLEEMIRWATWNGAEFLGITDRYGSFEPGKQPGINLLNIRDHESGRLSQLKRLF